MHDGFVLFEFQVAEGIDEESGAAADFVAQQRDTGAGVVVGFDDDVFELIAEILLDSGFVLFLDFGVIGEHADGAEFLAAVTFVGGKKFLHRFAGVGAVVQDLRERGVTRAYAGQRVAQRVRFLLRFFASLL